jgi:hypothetical protein
MDLLYAIEQFQGRRTAPHSHTTQRPYHQSPNPAAPFRCKGSAFWICCNSLTSFRRGSSRWIAKELPSVQVLQTCYTSHGCCPCDPSGCTGSYQNVSPTESSRTSSKKTYLRYSAKKAQIDPCFFILVLWRLQAAS